MRLLVEQLHERDRSLGSPGHRQHPLAEAGAAGDTITYRANRARDRAPRPRRPGVGLVKHRWEATQPAGELVLTMEGWGMFGRKPAHDAGVELHHKIHVLTKKEELDSVRVAGKVVVVLDILFATTTMVAALANGASEVCRCWTRQAARARCEDFPDSACSPAS